MPTSTIAEKTCKIIDITETREYFLWNLKGSKLENVFFSKSVFFSTRLQTALMKEIKLLLFETGLEMLILVIYV